MNVFRGRCRSEVEKLDHPLLSDPDGAVATAFGVRRWLLSSVIASEFDMTVHAQAARESSQNPDEQGT